MKVKKNFLYKMVNRGKIYKGQVGVFEKYLRVVLVYKIFYNNKP